MNGIDVATAARLLGKPRTTVYGMVERGDIPVVHRPARETILLDSDAVHAMVAAATGHQHIGFGDDETLTAAGFKPITPRKSKRTVKTPPGKRVEPSKAKGEAKFPKSWFAVEGKDVENVSNADAAGRRVAARKVKQSKVLELYRLRVAGDAEHAEAESRRVHLTPAVAKAAATISGKGTPRSS